MASVLVLYGTGEGQTAKVATHIEGVLVDRGHDARVVDVEEPPDDFSVDAFDAVLVGSSIHVGRHHESIRGFIEQHGDALAGRPTGFFQLSLSSAVDDPERRADAAKYADDVIEVQSVCRLDD